jgi:hypothetical protein
MMMAQQQEETNTGESGERDLFVFIYIYLYFTVSTLPTESSQTTLAIGTTAATIEQQLVNVRLRDNVVRRAQKRIHSLIRSRRRNSGSAQQQQQQQQQSISSYDDIVVDDDDLCLDVLMVCICFLWLF